MKTVSMIVDVVITREHGDLLRIHLYIHAQISGDHSPPRDIAPRNVYAFLGRLSPLSET